MKVISLRNREDWKDKRKIGSTDLCAVVNGKGRWNTIIDVYNKVALNKKQKEIDTEKTKLGTIAERPIRALFLLQHSELKRLWSESNYLLLVSDENELITLSPDTIVETRDTQTMGFVEIKYKEITNENKIGDYLCNLKEEEPQYYWQLIHYFVVCETAQFGYLVVAFVVKNKGTYEKTIIDSLKVEREQVKEDIVLAKTKLNTFIKENVETKQRPFFEKGDYEIWQTFTN